MYGSQFKSVAFTYFSTHLGFVRALPDIEVIEVNSKTAEAKLMKFSPVMEHKVSLKIRKFED